MEFKILLERFFDINFYSINYWPNYTQTLVHCTALVDLEISKFLFFVYGNCMSPIFIHLNRNIISFILTRLQPVPEGILLIKIILKNLQD